MAKPVVIATVAVASLTMIAVVAMRGADRNAVPDSLPVTRLDESRTADAAVRRLASEKVAAVEAAPDLPGPRCELALLYEANELWDEAIDAYRNCFRLGGERPVWTYHLALCLRGIGRNEEARGRLETVCGQNPTFDAAHYRLAQWLLNSDDPERALPYFERVAERVPELVEPAVGWGACLAAVGKFDEAIQVLEPAVNRDPQYKTGLYALGIAYRGAGRRDEARELLQMGMDAEPRFLPDEKTRQMLDLTVNLSGLLDRASNLIAAGRPDLAAQVLEERNADLPDDEHVMAALANAYHAEGKTERAIDLLKRTIEFAPDYFAARLNLALCLLDTNRLDEAEEQARLAVRLGPNVPDTHFALARVHARRGNLEGSWEALLAASRLDVANPEIFFALGETAAIRKDYENARQYFRKGTQLQPRDSKMWTKLAVTCVATGDQPAAWHAYDKVLSLVPDDPALPRLKSLIERMPEP